MASRNSSRGSVRSSEIIDPLPPSWSIVSGFKGVLGKECIGRGKRKGKVGGCFAQMQ